MIAVVAEAESWLDTPWHHRARIKGAGVDCIQLVIAVFVACGLCADVETGDYSQDWMMHRDEELLLEGLRRHAVEVDAPVAGDVVVYRFGRCYSHAAIVTGPGEIIHAYIEERAVVRGTLDGGRLAGRPRKFFRVMS